MSTLAATAALWALVMTIQWSNGQFETSVRWPYPSEELCVWHATAMAEAAPQNNIIIVDMTCRPFPGGLDVLQEVPSDGPPLPPDPARGAAAVKPLFDPKIGTGSVLTLISMIVLAILWLAETRSKAVVSEDKLVAVTQAVRDVAEKADVRAVQIINVLSEIKTGIAVQGIRIDDHGRRLNVIENRGGPPR